MNLRSGIFDLDAGVYVTDEAEIAIPLGWDPVNDRMLLQNLTSELGWIDLVTDLTHSFSTLVATTSISADYYFTQFQGDARNVRQGRIVASIGPLASGSAGPGESVVEYNLETGATDFTLNWPLFNGNEGSPTLGLVTTSQYRVFPSRCDTPGTPAACAQDVVFQLLSYGDDYSFAATLTTGLNAAGGLELTDFTNGILVKDLEDSTVAFSRAQRSIVLGGEFSDVFVAAVDTGARTNLTTGFLPGVFKHLVAVFPSQGKIAFATSVDGSQSGGISELYLMNFDGTGKALLATLPYNGAYVALGEPVGNEVLILAYEDGAVAHTDAHFGVLDAATGTYSPGVTGIASAPDYLLTYSMQSMPCE